MPIYPFPRLCLFGRCAGGVHAFAVVVGRYNNVTGQTSYQQTPAYGAGAATAYGAGAMVPQQSQVPMQPVYQQPVPVSRCAALSRGGVSGNPCDTKKKEEAWGWGGMLLLLALCSLVAQNPAPPESAMPVRCPRHTCRCSLITHLLYSTRAGNVTGTSDYVVETATAAEFF